MDPSPAYTTRSFYYPPLQRSVTILRTPMRACGLIPSIFNNLVLRNQIEIAPGRYQAHEIVARIRTAAPTTEDLSAYIGGIGLSPRFDNCNGFTSYPRFLIELQIRLFHTMCPDPSSPNYDMIMRYDYYSLCELITSGELTGQDATDIREWLNVCRSVTPTAAAALQAMMTEGETAIYLISDSFFVITRIAGHVYLLNTSPSECEPDFTWGDLPGTAGNLYDERFNCVGQTSAAKRKKRRRSSSSSSSSSSSVGFDVWTPGFGYGFVYVPPPIHTTTVAGPNGSTPAGGSALGPSDCCCACCASNNCSGCNADLSPLCCCCCDGDGDGRNCDCGSCDCGDGGGCDCDCGDCDCGGCDCDCGGCDCSVA